MPEPAAARGVTRAFAAVVGLGVLAAFAVFGVFALAGCARQEPPSGGPPDLTPPRLVSSSPDSGRAGVPVDARLSLTFSEAMEPRSTQDAVQLSPAIPFKQRRWNGRTLVVTLEQPLRPDHVYTLIVGPSAKDRHGNNMTSGAKIGFTTGAIYPIGRIDGDVEARGFEAAGTYLWCYEASRTHVPDSTGRDFDAIGLVDDSTRFRISGLKTPGRYRLWAFGDLDLNRSFDPDRDVLAAIDTTIELTVEHPVAGPIHLRLLNPRAAGTVRGSVLDSLRDSLGVTRVLAVSKTDSTLIGLADVDREGHFELSLRGGTWIVRAFQDEDRNRDWQPAREPASDTLRVVLEPAGDVSDLKFVLRKRAGRP